MPSPGWYYRLSRFFKETFGEKVYKIPLDAGFSCPNRDGTISTGGCIFCYNPSFSPAALAGEREGRLPSVREQIRSFQLRAEKKGNKFEARQKAHEEFQKHEGYKAHEMQAAKTAESSCPARYDKVTPWEGSCPVSRSTESSRKAAQRDPETTGNSCSRRQSGAPAAPADAKNFQPRRKYLAYFQAYSNTYAPLPHLQKLYEEALSAPGIVGLSIATRPDCLGPGVLELLQSYAQKYHIWLELGLQSSSDRTLRLINRGHTYRDFEQAVLEEPGPGNLISVHTSSTAFREKAARRCWRQSRRSTAFLCTGSSFTSCRYFGARPWPASTKKAKCRFCPCGITWRSSATSWSCCAAISSCIAC
ncbi:MAG: hypothetical protein ACOX1I_07375 [Dethiobacteria bacterium]